MAADPTGETLCFEKGADKQGGGEGFADVWKKDFFGWEYKGRRKDLDAAYDQLLLYRDALANPPLLVVCDLDRIVVHTNFTGTVSVTHLIPLDRLDWSAVDPSIFGTLFERGLDPDKRSQLGTHFTGRADIELLVDAVVMQPLRREWAEARQTIENLLATGRKNPPDGRPGGAAPPKPLTAAALKKAWGEAEHMVQRFLTHLQSVKVLDPACGSGNFQCRDAILNPDGTEPDWPRVDFIVGNPPFLGGNRIRQELGEPMWKPCFATTKVAFLRSPTSVAIGSRKHVAIWRKAAVHTQAYSPPREYAVAQTERY